MSAWSHLAIEIESAINSGIAECYPYAWEENHITHAMLGGIRSAVRGRKLVHGREAVSVEFETYKLDGRYEKNFGDIVFLVNIVRKGQKPILGAAFVEAKRRSLNGLRYPEIRVQQARRILKVAPRAFYVLYDYDFTTRFVSQEGFDPWGINDRRVLKGRTGFAPVAKVLCTPINAALANSYKDVRLYNQALPFTTQLMTRYLCGLDLEYGNDALAVAAGWRENKGLPKQIVRIDVCEDGEEVEASSIPVNVELYRRGE
ncbi:hypothetical protein [Thioalkalivibrio sp. ALE31]|uniref:hypothetical protein n=1 Tax=Thioalkalivibrio sp. ALE31 TaxID=1158182 RepID=UPI0012DD475F|nr:hypothetical protein [Thioalkalivibrio sp. ALE31]